MFPFGVTVVIRRPGVPARHGDPTTAAPDRPVPGCARWPRGSTEITSLQDTVTTDETVVMPVGTDIEPTDQVLLDGKLFDVDGDPVEWISPFSGWDPGIVVTLKKATG